MFEDLNTNKLKVKQIQKVQNKSTYVPRPKKVQIA